MVVIKGVRTFQNGKSQEYSDLDIMQMLGRAVRHTRIKRLLTLMIKNKIIGKTTVRQVVVGEKIIGVDIALF